MSFDDLAFSHLPSSSSRVRRWCPACAATREVSELQWTCPQCGEQLLTRNAQNGGVGGDEHEQHATGHPLAHLLHSSLAAVHAGEDLHTGDGSGSGHGVSSMLQQLFIPSLNSTYAEMIQAQRGISIDELMQRLLEDSELNAPPTSKRFIERLEERALIADDFVQLYLRFSWKSATASSSSSSSTPDTQSCIPLLGLDRDVFPTVASFGSGQQFVRKHAQRQQETARKQKATNDAEVKDEEKKNGNSTGASASTSANISISFIPSQQHLTLPLILASPPTGAGNSFTNRRLFRGNCVFVQRGAISFVAKTRLIQDAMGRAMICGQTEEDSKAWPYQMSDSTNTSSDIVIPALMISKSDATALQSAVEKKKASDPSGELTVSVWTRERPLACCVCREDYEVGTMTIELPCHHHYCKECILPWLSKRSSCPLCRFALPTDAPKTNEDLMGPESNHAQLQRDMFT